MTHTKPQLPVMNKIANKIEDAINNAWTDETELKVERRNTSKFIQIKVSNPQAFVLTLDEVELVRKAISDIYEAYEKQINIIFDTDPIICNVGIIYQAVMSITIHK